MWTDLTLAVDADLTQYESAMPEQAKKFKGDSGASAYDGKREIAKRDIYYRLRRMSFDVDTVADPAPYALTRTAVFRELSLIFRDLGKKNDTVSQQKADYYADLYDESFQDLILELGIESSQAGIGFISAFRA